MSVLVSAQFWCIDVSLISSCLLVVWQWDFETDGGATLLGPGTDSIRWWCWTPVCVAGTTEGFLVKWGLWPVSSSTGGQHIFFFSQSLFYLHHIVLVSRCCQMKRCVGVGGDEKLFPTENSSWQQRKQTPTVQRRCKVFLISILECDFAWWEIKSKLLQAHLSYRGAIVEVRSPSQQDWLFGAGGPRAASAVFVLTVWNTSRCDKSELRNSLLLWNLKSQGWHHRHRPSCCSPASDLSSAGRNRKSQIPQITAIDFLLLLFCKNRCQDLQGVSTVSALWFTSRRTGMHWWFCFVVISHFVFHWGGTMTAGLLPGA